MDYLRVYRLKIFHKSVIILKAPNPKTTQTPFIPAQAGTQFGKIQKAKC